MKKMLIMLLCLFVCVSLYAGVTAKQYAAFKEAYRLPNEAASVEQIDEVIESLGDVKDDASKTQLKSDLECKKLAIAAKDPDLADQAWIDLKAKFEQYPSPRSLPLLALTAKHLNKDVKALYRNYADDVDFKLRGYVALRVSTTYAVGEKDQVNALKYFKIGIMNLSSKFYIFDALNRLKYIDLDPDDVYVLSVKDAETAIKNIKDHYRKQGRVNQEEIQAAITQLTEGGDARPFVHKQQWKDLATEISNGPDIEHKQFLVDYFNGNFDKAFVYCYNKTTTTKADTWFKKWVDLANKCLVLHYQNYNKEPLDYLKWVKGEVEVNPVQDLIDQ